MTTAAPFLQRHFGDYLLVAQLSEDPLGTVFRALYAVDERRFVRLRILQSEDLVSEPVERAVAGNAGSLGRISHDALVARPHLDSVEGIPFMCWDEAAGWTLDTMLARVRAFGIRIPAEYALLIAERIAAALEHAQLAGGSGPEARHGLLWPGFVSISHDAAVRVGGFGVADGIRPSLSRGKIATEIAPYVAPEARAGRAAPSSDVYSLGAILVELLTGRRPAPEGPSAELRAADPRSDELQRFLQRCLAPEAERFATPAEAHKALQQIVTGNPFSLYTANLALFLYKLLNPESQSGAPSSDFESTNPVVRHGRSGDAAPAAPSSAGSDGPRRRADDFADVDEAVASLGPTTPEGAGSKPEPIVFVFPANAEMPRAIAALATPGPAGPADSAQPDEAASEGAFAAAESRVAKMSFWKDPVSAAAPPEPPAPVEVVARATGPFEDRKPRRHSPIAADWRRPAAALAAAAGVTVGVFLVASRISLPAQKEPAPADAARVASSEPAPPAAPVAPAGLAAAPSSSAEAAVTFADVVSSSRSSLRVAAARKSSDVRPELRRPAEELRLRAALARIEADRVNARETARDLFGEGRHSEEEGERLLRAQDYESAQLAFTRAANLFQKAQELSWEDRVRRASLSGGGEGTVTK